MLTSAFRTHPYKPTSVYSQLPSPRSCTVSLPASLPNLQARRTPLPSCAHLISPSSARSATVGLFLCPRLLLSLPSRRVSGASSGYNNPSLSRAEFSLSRALVE
ncbi:unnamed protein product [Victoria cruziana]